jgi:hypothetical protein
MVGMETLRCPTCVTLLPDPDARRCPACHAKLRKRRSRPIVLGESNRLSGRSLPVDTELRTRAEERFEPFEPFVSKAKRKTKPVEAVIAFTPSDPEPVAPEPVPEPDIVFAEAEPAPVALVDAAEADAADTPAGASEVAEPAIDLTEADDAPEPIAETALDQHERESSPLFAFDWPETKPDTVRERVLVDDLAVFTMPVAVAVDAVEDGALDQAATTPGEIDLAEDESEPVMTNGHVSPTELAESESESESEARPPRPASRWQAVPARGASASPFDGTLNDMVAELHRKAREDVGKHR